MNRTLKIFVNLLVVLSVLWAGVSLYRVGAHLVEDHKNLDALVRWKYALQLQEQRQAERAKQAKPVPPPPVTPAPVEK
jgi:hypothetical protein